MGNNISSNKSDVASSRKSKSRQSQLPSSPSSIASIRTASSPSLPVDQQQQENSAPDSHIHAAAVSFNKPEKRPLRSSNTASVTESTHLPVISEKQRGKMPDAFLHLDKLPADRHSMQHKRIKSQRNSRQFTSNSSNIRLRERYSSTISASGFSSTINDPLHFSMVGDSTITDITNASGFSVNSFLDKTAEDNNYIMAIPDTDFVSSDVPNRSNNSTPSTELVSSTQDILDLLTQHPDLAYDILTSLFGSERIRSNAELQKEAFQAAETWSLRPTDVSAKVIVACCKLCGWGTSKKSKKGFNELQALANKGVWIAFYLLGKCYHFGVEQASEGYNLSGRPLSAHVIQPVDTDQAIHWYRKVINTPSNISSERAGYYIASAQLQIASINFTSGKITDENVDTNIQYLKDSVAAGNIKAEFSLGLLLQLGLLKDTLSAKDYYTRSAAKGYAPSQVQLALILLKDDSPEGISWLSKAARQGDPRALYYLGDSYELGKGVKADPVIAAHNYQTSADTYNYYKAEFRLGVHHLNGGLGLDKDYGKAFHYLDRAARSGFPDAQYLLGMMYCDGTVPLHSTKSVRQTSAELSRNKKEAFRWVRKAANQNMHPAISQIAHFYEDGVGTPVNYALATDYYEWATSIKGQFLPSAQQMYARFLHKNGNYNKALEMYLFASGLKRSPLNTHPPSPAIARVAKRMVALLYLDAKDTTTPYKPKEALSILKSLAYAPEGSDADAHYWIAVCYEEGVEGVVRKDLSKAFEHYTTAANLGSSDSQFQVGHMLCKGIGVKEDRLAAFDWFQKSADKNNAKALYYIGIYYYNGSGSIPRDHEQARLYFKRSAELNHAEAMVSYAQICQEKLKDASSMSKAELDSLQAESMRWYTRAAKQDHTTALRELGRLYGARGDFKTSFECYQKASNLNDALSTLFLGGYYENGQGVVQNKQTALKYYTKAIELGQPTALFAIAELYDKLQDYEKAYNYYKRVTLDSRISKHYRSSKVSRFKMALYSLNYDPNTVLSETPAPSKIAGSIHSLLPKTEAFLILKKLALDEHFTDAYNWIAECYHDGRGVQTSTTESIQWRIKASQEANDLQATMRLAYMYQHGIDGVQKNLMYSHQLYQLCGEKNHVISQHKLGMIFWRGNELVPINLGMAVIWFTRSARQGYAPSHWALGQIALENGDLHIAIAWWETAMKLNGEGSDPITMDQLLTTTADAESLVILGKIIQNQHDSELIPCSTSVISSSSSSLSNQAESTICIKQQENNIGVSVQCFGQAESITRAQQENHGLAVRCFGQAASMGNVEGMYLTAQAWHQDKDYPVALENYERAAAQGHIPSRIMCATYQIHGLGGKQTNAEEGYKELLHCAQYHPGAYIHLGRCCERGQGTVQDIDKALQWYHRSIESLQDAESMFYVGQVHAIHRKDEMTAVSWYQGAISKSNHPRANYCIAFYYAYGVQEDDHYLLEPDVNAAVHHFRSAAQQNDQDAMFELGQLLLSPAYADTFSTQLQEEGLCWYEAAAELGSRDAQRELGHIYHTGRDQEEEEWIAQDFEKAFDYFSCAAHLGDKTSALFLGTYYEHGICVPPSLERAHTWYTTAIELSMASQGGEEEEEEEGLPLYHGSGWWPAQLCLARVLHQNTETQSEAYKLFTTVYSHRPEQHLAYLQMMLALYQLNGLGGVPVQAEKAVATLVLLAEQGYLKAFFPVAQCYELGIGVEKDVSKALQWYVLLVHHPVVVDQDTLEEDDLDDLAHAYFCLAEFYREGKVVAVDTEKSTLLYKIAAERGSDKAKRYLDTVAATTTATS